MSTEEMKALLDEIARLAAIIYADETLWRSNEITWLPPVSEELISSLNAELPFPLPSSYESFLKIANGCVGFWPDFFLLGTSGEPFEQVKAEVHDARETMGQYAADANGNVTPESIRQFEMQPVPAGRPPWFFLSAHTVFGVTGAGGFLFFDEKHIGPNDEPSVVWYTYSARVLKRYDGFEDFLLKTQALLEKRAANKKARLK